MQCVYISKPIRNKINASCFTFPIIPITWTHCTIPPQWPSVLLSSALHIHYYHPYGLQVLPPSAIQPVQVTVYPNFLYPSGLVLVQLWDSVFFTYYYNFFFHRVDDGHFICGGASSFKMKFSAFSYTVFVQALVRLNNDFKFTLCACVTAAVDISFLCPCLSRSIRCHFNLFIDHLYGTLSTDF